MIRFAMEDFNRLRISMYTTEWFNSKMLALHCKYVFSDMKSNPNTLGFLMNPRTKSWDQKLHFILFDFIWSIQALNITICKFKVFVWTLILDLNKEHQPLNSMSHVLSPLTKEKMHPINRLNLYIEIKEINKDLRVPFTKTECFFYWKVFEKPQLKKSH